MWDVRCGKMRERAKARKVGKVTINSITIVGAAF
jgi:hypothetical protein